MLKKISTIIITAAIALFPILVPASAYAADSSTSSKCGNTKTEYISCDSKTGLGTINDLIRISLMVLSVVIGAVAVGAFAYAGIIYASARDEQGKVTEAKTIMRNVTIGLVLYVMTIAIIGWLLPGTVVEAPEDTTGTPASSGSVTTP